MKDVNGIEIRVGQKVKTQQKSGGIFNPAPAETGEVILYKLSYQEEKVLAIKYPHKSGDFFQHILLYGKINEVIS